MTRRHPDVNPTIKQNNEIEKELEKIKERLRLTENELMTERNSRLGFSLSQAIRPVSGDDSVQLLKQLEEAKNIEIKKQKEEMKRNRDSFKRELKELTDKNSGFEKTIKELEERLGKQSHVGWMKDDIDIQKDMVINQKQEIDKLNHLVNYFFF